MYNKEYGARLELMKELLNSVHSADLVEIIKICEEKLRISVLADIGKRMTPSELKAYIKYGEDMLEK